MAIIHSEAQDVRAALGPLSRDGRSGSHSSSQNTHERRTDCPKPKGGRSHQIELHPGAGTRLLAVDPRAAA